MTQDEKYDFVENYLNGSIPEDEFQDKLKNNPELQKELEMHQDLEAYLNSRSSNNYKAYLKEVIDDHNKKATSLNFNWYVAASIAGIIIFSGIIFFWLRQPEPTHQELFAQNFSPYEGIGVTRSEQETDQFQIAMSYYESGEYIKAIEHFNDIPSDASPFAQFYLGISYLAIGKSEQAITSLSGYAKPQNILNTPAHWYLALAYLQEGNLIKTNQYLQLIKDDPTWGNKSKELMDKLKRD